MSNNSADPFFKRCVSLDAMRGLVMLVLCWGVALNFAGLEKYPAYQSFSSQFRHRWEGVGVWELVMPTFWFAVGASLPFALARRREQCATFMENLRHACIRVLKLIVLGQILVSLSAGRLHFTFMETLTHLGICYLFCFLILHLRWQWQLLIAVLLIAVTTALYLGFPGAEGPFSVNDNFGKMVDRTLFGDARSGPGAVNFNVVPTTVHMLFGAWTAMLLVSGKSSFAKLVILIAASLASILAGLALALYIPVIQNIFTASFAFYSAGYVFALFAVFFWLFDVKGCRWLAFPLVVVGMNAIFLYMLDQALGKWLDHSVGVFTERFQFLGPIGVIAHACAVTFVMWCVCFWLYRRNIFFKV